MTNNVLKIFKAIFIIVFYFLFPTIIIYLLSYFGIDINSLNNNIKLGVMIAIDFLFILFLYLVYHKDINNNFSDFKINFGKYFKFGIRWWLFGIFLMYLSNIIISIYVPSGPTNEIIVRQVLNEAPLYMFISSVMFAPFIEEIVFRRTIKEIFTNNVIYIIMCGIIFGGIHVLSSNTYLQLIYIIPYGVFGLIFGYLYVKTNNIFTSMIFHFIHNFIIVTTSIILSLF